MNIVCAPDARLRQVCTPFEAIDDDVFQLADLLQQTLAATDLTQDPGIGLAAPQIGYNVRMIALAVPGFDPCVMVNPVIMHKHELQWSNEGCLSLPGKHARIRRANRLKVTYLDLAGKAQVRKASGLFAACIQHEIDHLDGVLFTDHVREVA